MFARAGAGVLFAAGIAALCATFVVSPAHGTASNQRTTLGPEDQLAPIAVTVWLKLHNEAALDTMVAGMYDKTSPMYHQWLTPAQYKSQFAPSAQDTATVRSYLASYNLGVVAADPGNHYLVAQGRVADAQRAFNVQLNRVMVNGDVHRVASSNFSIAGPAGAVVAAVQGLSDRVYNTNVVPAHAPGSKTPYSTVKPSAVGPDGLFFSSDCLRPPETRTFTTNGGLPKAVYTGNRYGADIKNAQPPNLPPCGYDAAEMQKAYGLNQVYNKGYGGAGQTIVIVDAYGSNTILDDANLFSKLNGLPPLNSRNFQIVYPNGPVKCTAKNGCISGNWNLETTLDVEWAHAIAPDADIVLVVGADNSFSNLDTANLYAIQNGYGSVISNSFGIPEIILVTEAQSELVVENKIAKIAAALGISLNVSSGDAGDAYFEDIFNFGLFVTSVQANADSPYATGIGGTSTFLNAQNQIKLQTGWGLNVTVVADAYPNPPIIPPEILGFFEGSGGGTSVYYSKPPYQQQLGGQYRKVPDISMNADPYTGNEIVFTPDSVQGHPQEVGVVGGTSLSCPMFSAFWAIANQAAIASGVGAPLGQAAPILYHLPSGAITDVSVPAAATKNNVTGTIYNPPNPVEHFSAAALIVPQEPTNQFLSALYHESPSTYWYVISFGTDSSLATNPGWDDVTGLGTPNGLNFINAVVAEAKH